MTVPPESRPRPALLLLLTGIEAGMLAALAMLSWLGATAVWRRRGFWSPENLMASLFHGHLSVGPGWTSRTLSGLAFYLLLYSALGAVFALAAQDRLPRFRLTLVGILFGLCWYYVSFHGFWRALAPALAGLHLEGPTIWGHALYGAVLSRYPDFLRRLEPPVRPKNEPAEPAESAPGAGTPRSETGA